MLYNQMFAVMLTRSMTYRYILCTRSSPYSRSSLNSKAAGEEVSMGANPAYEVNCKI